MEEEITIIPGLHLYGATRSGRIFSRAPRGVCKKEYVEWRPLRLLPDGEGRYLMFGVSRGPMKKMLVHRAIALAFIGPIPKGMHAAHLNGNSMDNRAENISIVTPTQNNAHKRLHGTHLFGVGHPSAKLNDYRVHVIKKLLDRGVRGYRIASMYGVSAATISLVKDGILWSHTGSR